MTKRQQYINIIACSVFVSLILFILKVPVLWYIIPGALLLSGLLFKPVRTAILWAWLRFSHALGTINSAIILFLIYFLIITPYALLFRKKIGGNYILRKPVPGASLFKERKHTVSKEDFEKSW